MINITIAEDNIFSLKAIEKNFQSMMILPLSIRHKKATRKVKQYYPHIKIVMISIYDDGDYIFNAIKAGTYSYILKETKAEKNL